MAYQNEQLRSTADIVGAQKGSEMILTKGSLRPTLSRLKPLMRAIVGRQILFVPKSLDTGHAISGHCELSRGLP